MYICIYKESPKSAYAIQTNLPDFTYPELNADQGSQTADTLRNVANAAASAVCGLYEAYPRGIIPQFGDPTGVGNFTDGLLNRLCAPRGQVPIPPSQPFSGGQCECVQYRVGGNITGFGTPDQTFDLFAFGSIGGIVNNKTESGENRYGFFAGGAACGGRVFRGVIQSTLDGTVVITSVVPFPSVPDNCGNPPVEYPIVNIPPIAFSPNIDINLPGGLVNIPVVVIPTVIAPTLNFRPEINVNVGGINVNFNLGGIDLSSDTSGGVTITLPGGDTRPLPPTPITPKEPRAQACDLTEVNRKLDEIKECACGAEKVLKSVLYASAKGRQVSVPPDTQYAVIRSVPTSRVKYQVSEGNAPDVFHVGSASWGVGTITGERIPLNYALVGLEAPENATSFAYSLVYDSTATLEIYYLEETP